MFEQRGYQKVDFNDVADVYIINTCSVTDNADKKCRYVIKQARKTSPHAYIAIIGCYAQLKPKEIAEIEGVNAVLGAAEKFRLFEVLDDFTQKETVQVCASEISQAQTFNHAYSYGDRTRTFLKVQDGCDYHCSFCTIPAARGASRSDTLDNIINSAQEIAKTSVKEVVLTGVNTGDFGLIEGERKHTFFDLVKEIDEVEGLDRIRISSIEPNLLSNDIIEFVAQSKRFVPHFHIPLQSGSDHILRLMRRKYKTELYTERVTKIKSLMPDACIGVDVIVGFPQETEEEFLKTYKFLAELDIAYLHVFTYSERADTRATSIKGVVPKKVRQERSERLRALSEKKKRYFYEQQLGKEVQVLWEHDVKNNRVQGYSQNYVRLVKDYQTKLPNTIETVQMSKINEDGLVEIV
jgi:threonylcarbamoyladenosine tRNA methylthiotransferase MtaB